MRKLATLIIPLVLLFSAVSWADSHADPVRGTDPVSQGAVDDTQPRRVLAIIGDPWHRPAALDRHLVSPLRQNGWEAVVIIDYEHIPWDDFDSFDLIILSREGREYVQFFRERDTNPEVRQPRERWLTKEQSLKFVDFVNAGGSMFMFHDGFGDYPCDYGPSVLARSCFIRHPPIGMINVTPTGLFPELTVGVTPFVVADEEYEVDMDESETSVFLESHSPQHGRAPQGWAHTFGEGKVAVLIPGHRMDTIQHPMINQLIANVLEWLTE